MQFLLFHKKFYILKFVKKKEFSFFTQKATTSSPSVFLTTPSVQDSKRNSTLFKITHSVKKSSLNKANNFFMKLLIKNINFQSLVLPLEESSSWILNLNFLSSPISNLILVKILSIPKELIMEQSAKTKSTVIKVFLSLNSLKRSYKRRELAKKYQRWQNFFLGREIFLFCAFSTPLRLFY